jgi:elongation factor Ts
VSVEDNPASTSAAEEQAPAEGGGAAAEGTESAKTPVKTLGRSNTIKRQSSGAKREITVTNEQLVPGAVFTGKVRAVQTYGAFVDIGAFTDGLVHISQLSSEYVKEVSEVVKVGQEVSVTVVELNEKSGRIALSMRDKESEAEQQSSRSGGESSGGSGTQGESSGKPMNRGKIAGRGSGNARSSSRSNDDRKATKLKKGQELKGTVKNIIRNGAFIEFAEEGEEGFLRGSEIQEGGENVAVDTLLTVGQEVTVRVLKIERGKAALTMKPQVDMSSINDSLNTNVGAGGASNPFATFFRAANLAPAATPVEKTPAVEEASSAEETPAPAAVDETPAVEETASTEAAQSDEGTKDDSAKTEEPHSLSLPEIAENIGDAVAEAEKVVEAAASTVRDTVDAAL